MACRKSVYARSFCRWEKGVEINRKFCRWQVIVKLVFLSLSNQNLLLPAVYHGYRYVAKIARYSYQHKYLFVPTVRTTTLIKENIK
jgi:hypothetical protein